MQTEITEPGDLLTRDGFLAQRGWARQPLLDCNLESLALFRPKFPQWLRVKKWDYYAVFTPSHFFSATVADIGYIGNIFVYLIDLNSGWYHEESLLTPLAHGVNLPRNSTSGDVLFDNGRARLAFDHLPGGDRRVQVEWPGFYNQTGIKADIILRELPGHESVVMATPIGQKRFYYNRKMNCLTAEGWIKFGRQTITAAPETSLGGLDWGRGVWEYNSFWNWASASSMLADGRRIGLNLGEGFGDLSYATENAVILDGKIHKLGNVPFAYDASDFKKPWRFVDEEDRLDLVFEPFVERVAKTNLGLLSSEVHQLFGRYSGRVVLDGGQVIMLDGITGFAEEHRAKW